MSSLKSLQLILASASPRRAKLLSQIGLTFERCPSDVVESTPCQNKTAETVTQALALKKAASVAKRRTEGVIIGADTLVSFERRLLGKPSDAAEALEMLMQLSGTCHEVVTGVALIELTTRREVVWAETTKVYFRELSSAEMTAYIASGEALDKAGGYGIQARGAAFVKRIEGCYFNVVGLPLASLVEHLSNLICE